MKRGAGVSPTFPESVLVVVAEVVYCYVVVYTAIENFVKNFAVDFEKDL